jgi:hypothetical protein
LWIEDSHNNRWEYWLSKMCNASKDVYFYPEYSRLYEDENTKAACFIFNYKEKIFYYPFLKRPVPFFDDYFDIDTPYGYGGPIYNSTDTFFLKDAYMKFQEGARNRKIVAECVKFHPLMKNHVFLDSIYNGKIMENCQTVYVDINADESDRWKNKYSHSNRKNINKAERHNIIVRFSQDIDLWEKFIDLYTSTMKVNNANEFYYFSKSYFDNIRKNLKSHYIIATCHFEDQVIAGMLVLTGSEYAHCHLIGTDRKYLRLGVNNLLHHKLIGWCKKKNYSILHIGGGRTNHEDDPLLKFKKNFSDKTAGFFVGEQIFNQKIYDALCEEWGKKNPDRQINQKILQYRC